MLHFQNNHSELQITARTDTLGFDFTTTNLSALDATKSTGCGLMKVSGILTVISLSVTKIYVTCTNILWGKTKKPLSLNPFENQMF